MKIKSISKAVLLFALLTSTSFAAGKNVNVEFRKGHSSAQYSGEIKGYDYDTYTFYAKKGQKVHVSISNEGADTYLFGPGIDDSVDLSRYSPELDRHGQYSLPASGKYELRVPLPRFAVPLLLKMWVTPRHSCAPLSLPVSPVKWSTLTAVSASLQ